MRYVDSWVWYSELRGNAWAEGTSFPVLENLWVLAIEAVDAGKVTKIKV